MNSPEFLAYCEKFVVENSSFYAKELEMESDMNDDDDDQDLDDDDTYSDDEDEDDEEYQAWKAEMVAMRKQKQRLSSFMFTKDLKMANNLPDDEEALLDEEEP